MCELHETTTTHFEGLVGLVNKLMYNIFVDPAEFVQVCIIFFEDMME